MHNKDKVNLIESDNELSVRNELIKKRKQCYSQGEKYLDHFKPVFKSNAQRLRNMIWLSVL